MMNMIPKWIPRFDIECWNVCMINPIAVEVMFDSDPVVDGWISVDMVTFVLTVAIVTNKHKHILFSFTHFTSPRTI